MRRGTILLLLLAFRIEASPVPVIDFRLQHYLVSGQTIPQIKQSMFQNSPVRDEGGVTFGGLTVNTIQTTYDLHDQSPGGCVVRNPMVRLTSVVTLPKLVDSVGSSNVAVEWQRYIGALRAHELMHAQNGRKMAETVLQKLNSVSVSVPCGQISVKLKNSINGLINKMSEYDRLLDEKTNHGETQGARLNELIR